MRAGDQKLRYDFVWPYAYLYRYIIWNQIPTNLFLWKNAAVRYGK